MKSLVFSEMTIIQKMVKLLSITPSKAEGKKYTATFQLDSNATKKVNFGAKGMDDYTLTHDTAQRERYRKRHAKDLETRDYTRAGFLSYYILWGDSTDMQTNIKSYKQKFHLQGGAYSSKYASSVYTRNPKILLKDGEEVPVVHRTVQPYVSEHNLFAENGINFMFAVAADDPLAIVYNSQFDGSIIVPADLSLRAPLRRASRLYHNDLVYGKDVLCAGMLVVLKKERKLKINNHSGHYQPKPECLQLVKKLLNDLGYENVEVRKL